MNVLVPTTIGEVGEALRAAPRVRIRGGGSRQDRLPDASGAAFLDLARLDTIERLDAPDQTCTVQAGVPREALDAALADHGLELGCLGAGTLGGLCASDPLGAAAPGAASPRSLVLGMEALLADGTAFRSGARVVKNVAGFDLHKLFVGSRGLLFVATRLHLRLRPQPRAAAWFAVPDLDADGALRRFLGLRGAAVPPTVLRLARDRRGAFEVAGRIAGRASFVRGELARHGLPESGALARLHLQPPAGGEVLAGTLLPSRLPRLLAVLPAGAELLLYGGNRCEIAVDSPAATDALLAQLPGVPCSAAVVGGNPARRGRGTPCDAGQQRLAEGLRRTLDPDGKFA